MNIGLIGFGRLGKLATRFLAKDFDVVVFDVNNNLNDEIKKLGARPCDFETVCSQQIVLVLVPISAFEDVIKQMAPKLRTGSIIIDACSVKERPIESMKKYLPESVSILGTHPMFGPDSIKDSLFGAKIVVCKVRMDEGAYNGIVGYLNNNGMRVIETDPQTHDQEIGHSLVLTHFIGRGLMQYGAKDLLIDTKGYRRLMRILETVVNDSWQLFEDMNRYNRFAKSSREDFIKALQEISRKVE